jgi:hypothetical protein
MKERKITLISRLSYADRQSFGNSISSGIQYEFETYIKTIKRILTLILPSATFSIRNYDLGILIFIILKAWEGIGEFAIHKQ